MGFEIDFLAVGEESKSGDAIALRYGNLHGARNEQTVVIVDAGFTDTGTKLADFVRARYNPGYVDLLISTHPDQDHVGGLKTVVETLALPGVTQLWMHKPWEHSSTMDSARGDSFKSIKLSEPVQKSFQGASELESVATQHGVEIFEPFVGLSTRDGTLQVLGPTREYYEELLLEVRPPTLATLLAEAAKKAARAVINMVHESFDEETLRDDGETQPQNNTSVITLLSSDGRSCLLTGDAGIPALELATDALGQHGVAPGGLTLVQVPHHGSRRNVGPAVLDRILGPAERDAQRGSAIASVAPDGAPKHPSKKVTNAFQRRGYQVALTKGINYWYRIDAPDRSDYGPADHVPFYDSVEDET
jgi:beta-lactamase superfamily II metal-dependent hydrolase